MAKRCAFCEFESEDDAAFREHVSREHGWQGRPRAAHVLPVVPAGGVVLYCGNCGARREDASVNFCRTCGTPFAAPPGEAAARPLDPVLMPKAGFWTRTGAYLIDVLALLAVGFVLGVVFAIVDVDVASEPVQFALNLAGVAYFVYFWSGRGGGQTIGMRLLNIRVIRTDGGALTIPRAFLRYIGMVLSALVLLIGLIWVAFDAQRQGWHDKIAGTYVVRV